MTKKNFLYDNMTDIQTFNYILFFSDLLLEIRVLKMKY